MLLAIAACSAAPADETVYAARQERAAFQPAAETPVSTKPVIEPLPPAGEENSVAALATAWSSGDVERIRSFYAADAAYLSVADAITLQRAEPALFGVSNETFPARVGEHRGQTMRLIGQPQAVYDKLLGFAFRWEGAAEGYDGVALLRYEGDQILLHTYALSDEATPNPPANSEVLSEVDVTPIMETWSSGDAAAVQALYKKEDGVYAVFNDEDILLSLRGEVLTPAELAGGYLASEVTTQAGPWGMQASGSPVRLGDFVLFTWGWESFDYPIGHGVRFLRYDGQQIIEDIRYAVRPWETQGQTFLSGYGTR